ncbi:MAG TPA: OsmC family protein [Rhizomicrobium sp.]|jgi:organic hydroperoxide reductase OsmC/OhrA|nr:OsmC family protein [Rhizomicrobium sp.]
MAEHKVMLSWSRGDAPFTYDAYPRNHSISFKNSAPVIFSSSPAYKGDASKGDPEDMLVAALSSCHMLSFLAIAAKKKVIMDSYEDDAVGFLENEGGKWWMTRVILRPLIKSSADAAILAEIHHLAHQACFIANSVKTDVIVEPRLS